MTGRIIVNGTDISGWIAPDGVSQTYVERRSRTVITMDGNRHRWAVRKRVLTVTLAAMEFETFRNIRTVFGTPGNTVTVSYPDTDSGMVTKDFYFENPGETFRSRNGANTFLDGISFTLEEV